MLGQTRDVGITPDTLGHNTQVSHFPTKVLREARADLRAWTHAIDKLLLVEGEVCLIPGHKSLSAIFL